MRIDKWLWSIRAFKSRELAAQACRHHNVTVNGQRVKPSRELLGNDLVALHTPPIWKQLRVLAFPPSRVGAARLPEFIQDETPQSDLDRLKESREQLRLARPVAPDNWRPDKKNRRLIHRFKDLIRQPESEENPS